MSLRGLQILIILSAAALARAPHFGHAEFAAFRPPQSISVKALMMVFFLGGGNPDPELMFYAPIFSVNIMYPAPERADFLRISGGEPARLAD
jgi:hypothetical protein